LHQAVEAKEQVPIQQESKTLATISFQNYFRMYDHLSGMTGTAATEAEEEANAPAKLKREIKELKGFCKAYAMRKMLKKAGLAIDYSQIDIPGMKRVMKKKT